MKNLMSLFIITLLLGLSMASTIASDTSVDDGATISTTSIDENQDENENEEKETPIADVKKEFMEKLNELKEEYKDRMDNEDSKKEFLKAKNELYAEYKPQLETATKEKRENLSNKAKEKRENLKNSTKEKRDNINNRVKEKRERYKAKREELRGKFRDSFNKNEKLKSRINQISDDKLGKLLLVIDKLVLKTEENTKLSDDRINSKIATYNALRDLIEAKLADSEENLIEGLLK